MLILSYSQNRAWLSGDHMGISDQDRVARLQQNFTKMGEGSKSRPGSSMPVAVSRPPFDLPSPVARVTRSREEQPSSGEPTARGRREDSRSQDPSAVVTGAKPIKRKSSVQSAVITKFDDRL